MMPHRWLLLAGVLLATLGVSGCVVAPAPGYYRAPPVPAGVYVGPRPYYSGYYRHYGPYYPRPYYYRGW